MEIDIAVMTWVIDHLSEAGVVLQVRGEMSFSGACSILMSFLLSLLCLFHSE